jgi:hypothetical protein
MSAARSGRARPHTHAARATSKRCVDDSRRSTKRPRVRDRRALGRHLHANRGVTGAWLSSHGRGRFDRGRGGRSGNADPRFTFDGLYEAVKRRAKLSGAYLSEYERALVWAALTTDEKALMGPGVHAETKELGELPSKSA